MMKRSWLLFLFLSAALASRAQADTLLGKWKFAGLDQKKTESAMPYEKFSPGTATPDYEYVEFKKEGECIYNEVNQEDAGGEYAVTGRKLSWSGAVYNMQFTGRDQLTLRREMYSYIDAASRRVLVRKEVLTFKRIF
jgi:hypothetical protein